MRGKEGQGTHASTDTIGTCLFGSCKGPKNYHNERSYTEHVSTTTPSPKRIPSFVPGDGSGGLKLSFPTSSSLLLVVLLHLSAPTFQSQERSGFSRRRRGKRRKPLRTSFQPPPSVSLSLAAGAGGMRTEKSSGGCERGVSKPTPSSF